MKPEDLEIIELLDLARDIKRKLEGFAAKDHKHPEYALTEHEHDAYSLKGHTHGDYAPKQHEHEGYAQKVHEHSQYAPKAHEHDQYAFKDHKHGDYAAKIHEHDGYAAKDHQHSEYAAKEHEHTAYAAKEHKHTDYAKKNHTHNGYALANHEHPELLEAIAKAKADAIGKVIVAAAQGIDPTTVAEDKVQTFILTHTGKKPMHLYDFFIGAHFNTANSIVAPGKTFAVRIVRHGSDLYVLFDGILTD